MSQMTSEEGKRDIKLLTEKLDLLLESNHSPQAIRDAFKILVEVFWLLENVSEIELRSNLHHLKNLIHKHSGVYDQYFSALFSYELLQCGDHHTIAQKIFGKVGEFLSFHGDLEMCLSILSWPDGCLDNIVVANGDKALCKGIIDVVCRSNLIVKGIVAELRSTTSKIDSFLRMLFVRNASLEDFCITEIFRNLFSNAKKKCKNSEPNSFPLVGGVVQHFDLNCMRDVIHYQVEKVNMFSNQGNVADENEILVEVGLNIFQWIAMPYSTNIDKIILIYCRALASCRRFIPLLNILNKEMDRICRLIKLPITRKAALDLYVNIQLSFRHNPMFFNKHCQELLLLIKDLKQACSKDVTSVLAIHTLVNMTHCLFKIHPGSLTTMEGLFKIVESYNQPSDEQLDKMISSYIPIFSGFLGSSIHNVSKTRGLANIGSTCYINCIIQCLFACIKFSKEVLESPIYSGQFSRSLQVTFANLLYSKRQTHLPSEIIDCSKQFFPFGFQQDCSEFLTYYLDVMSEELLQNGGESVVTQNFRGSMRNNIECLACGFQSNKTEHFSGLPISIPRASQESSQSMTYDLLELVKNHFKEEILEGDNMYLCDNCNEMVKARRKHSVTLAPEHLVIVLLRFHFDGQSRCRRKVSPIINCSQVINIPIWCERDDFDDSILSKSENGSKEVTYELKALTIHSGATLEAGHYYSVVLLNPSDQPKDSCGYLVDDTNVRYISKEEFVRITSGIPLQTPYVLFYTRKGEGQTFQLSEADMTLGLKNMVEEKDKTYKNEQKFNTSTSSHSPIRTHHKKDDSDDENGFPERKNFCDGPRLIF